MIAMRFSSAATVSLVYAICPFLLYLASTTNAAPIRPELDGPIQARQDMAITIASMSESELAAQAPKINPMVQRAAAVDRSTWTVSVDSQQDSNPAAYLLDGSTSTFWHSQWTPSLAPLPHTITLDMKTSLNINGLLYTPRQDGNQNGNIGQHRVEVSVDRQTWTTVAFGTHRDDSTVKTTPFTAISARYLRITALTEAGNRGPWTSAADFSVTLSDGSDPNAAPSSVGRWSPLIKFPVVPAAAAVLPDQGKLLVWSSYRPDDFNGGSTGVTQTATYDLGTGTVSPRAASNTRHDMFCPGISFDAPGRLVVTGGNSAPTTSIFDPAANAWSQAANMQKPRGYQSQTTLSDGRIFVIGGSWSGGEGGKDGEVYDPATNTWTSLPGCPVAPMLTKDFGGVYRADNHAWLFAWKSGYVFQAGPSSAMNWYRITGTGSRAAAGFRASDPDAMCGNAVMYDAVAGKILAAGGAPSYQGSQATANAHIITIGTPPATPSVTKINSMLYPRSYANGVVLPNGQVFIAGGQSMPIPFVDDTAQLTPELWDPKTNAFKPMAPEAAPRVYHSVAVLLPDATVFSGGGGLCGSCATNHFDGQIWSPPYLFTSSGAAAVRPVINSVSTVNPAVGSSFTITTNAVVTSFALVRYGSSTHTVNTDQRRIPLTPTTTSGTRYTFTLPADPGVVLPGPYMLFAINGAGVPSVSKTLRVRR